MKALAFALAMVASSPVVFAQCPSGAWCSGTFQYDGSANIKSIGADAYTYDVYGRLTSGTADVQRTGVQSRQNYAYDSFGNFTSITRDAGSVGCVGGCELSLTISAVTNHINGAQYDVAGNLIAIDTASYAYDAAGSLVRSTSSDDREFIYTADDERVATKNGVSWTWTVRGRDNKILREFTSAATTLWPTVNRAWAKDYVWRDGGLLAAAGSSFTQHYHLDHLATPRVVSNSAGVKIGVHAYYPFGAELDVSPHESNTELLKFTGHERDVLPGGPYALDNMHARYDMATMGRFLLIDPAPPSMRRPQSWNAYAYVLNNPVVYVDPTGRRQRCYWVGERKDGKGRQVCYEEITVYARMDTGNGGGSGGGSGSGGGGGAAERPRQFTREQCREARALLAEERAGGELSTSAVAAINSNTWTDKTTMFAFNNNIGGSPNFIMSDGREIDIDWFTDLAGTAGNPGWDIGPVTFPVEMRVLGAYLFGKPVSRASHIRDPGHWNRPFEDPGERTAILMVMANAKYSDIFTDELMAKECP